MEELEIVETKQIAEIKILRTASVVEAVKCMAEIWEQTKGWKDGKGNYSGEYAG